MRETSPFFLPLDSSSSSPLLIYLQTQLTFLHPQCVRKTTTTTTMETAFLSFLMKFETFYTVYCHLFSHENNPILPLSLVSSEILWQQSERDTQNLYRTLTLLFCTKFQLNLSIQKHFVTH
jgi:hypothetical protein